MTIWRGPGFIIAAIAGFLLAFFAPLLAMRSMTLLYVIIPVVALWVLWLMRVYQRWGREGVVPWKSK
jgi:hypothetical protein